MSSLAKEKKIQKKVSRQKAAIASILQKNSVKFLCDLHENICEIIQSNSTEVEKTFAVGSFRRLFWEKEKALAEIKGAQGMRWHPLIFSWALHLKSLFSSAYHSLRTPGFIRMPSERDYSNFYSKLFLTNKICTKKNLVYERHQQEIIGFVDLGDVPNQLRTKERSKKIPMVKRSNRM